MSRGQSLEHGLSAGNTQFIGIKLMPELVIGQRVGESAQRQIVGEITSQRGHVNRSGQRPVGLTIKEDVSIRGILNEKLV